MTITTSEALTLAALRAKRLQDVVDGYEVNEDGFPDSTVPGSATCMYGLKKQLIRHPRFVLVTQYDKGSYRLRLGAGRPRHALRVRLLAERGDRHPARRRPRRHRRREGGVR